jgi:hypothetical protein
LFLCRKNEGFVTSLQVLILYRDIIRTARIMTHKDKGLEAPCSIKLFHFSFETDGVPWSLKLISHARAEIEDARQLRDSEVMLQLA